MIPIFKNFLYSITILLTIISISLTKTAAITPSFLLGIEHLDKLVHLLMYFSLTITILIENSIYQSIKKLNIVLITILTIFFGLIMEGSQQLLTTYRTADIIDATANSMGALLALLLFHYQETNIKRNWLVTNILKLKNKITRL